MTSDNLSAFPVMPPCDEDGDVCGGYPLPDTGMTLRDYFAASALQGLIACGEFNIGAADCNIERCLSLRSYLFADEMLKQRGLHNDQ